MGPGRAAAIFNAVFPCFETGLALLWNHIERPEAFTGLGVKSMNVAGCTDVGSPFTNENFAVENSGSRT